MATKKTRRKKSPTSQAMAVHARKGIQHFVGIGNLRVIIVPDDGFWFAQGLEIDYAAQGSTKEEVKKQFEQGLFCTIKQHLQIYGSLKKFLKAAPPEVWNEFLFDPVADKQLYFHVSRHTNQQELPFDRIDYLEQRVA